MNFRIDQKNNLLKLFCCGAFSIMLQIGCAQEIEIPYNSDLRVDGNFDEWGSYKSFSFPSSEDSWSSNHEFGEKDLEVDLSIGTNENGIYLLFSWFDDVIDTKAISKDSSVLTTANGSRMDKMYLYDNIKVQIRTESTNHISWFTPSNSSLQWSLLRKKSQNSWSSTEISDPVYNYSTNKSKHSLELLLTWDHIGILAQEFDLLVLITDSDLDSVDEVARLNEERAFISLSSTIKLHLKK